MRGELGGSSGQEGAGGGRDAAGRGLGVEEGEHLAVVHDDLGRDRLLAELDGHFVARGGGNELKTKEVKEIDDMLKFFLSTSVYVFMPLGFADGNVSMPTSV